eukprot:TRINITY_DN104922_c0_g1_i1.p1 TRINITY_DN104922_c0_g1~~TRINITY_DN104922_c0_g1_i1.p1  ORF type:complete len:617 (-),score=95.47 TRINITY_DN104922_c0_g1_i1:15-1865(-)
MAAAATQTPSEEQLGHTTSQDVRQDMVGEVQKRPNTSWTPASSKGRERPLSARSREMLRRAAATGFRAASLRDPGGKMGAAARFSAPSPSPSPQSPSVNSNGIVGESMPLWSFTWGQKEHGDSGNTLPASSHSLSKGRSPSMTPLPILLAQVENECQLALTDRDLQSDSGYTDLTPAHVHFHVTEREPNPDIPLELIGMPLPTETPPKRNLILSPTEQLSSFKLDAPQNGYQAMYRISPPPNSSTHADDELPRSSLSLCGKRMPVTQQKKNKKGKSRTQPSPSQTLEMGGDPARDESWRLHGMSVETLTADGLEGRWLHEDDPEEFEIVRDGLVTSVDGTVRELSIKGDSIVGQGQLFLSTAHGRHMLGWLDQEHCSIRWQDGQVWRRDLSWIANVGLGFQLRGDEEVGAESATAALRTGVQRRPGQRPNRPRQPVEPAQPAFGNMPAELRRLVRGIPQPRSPRNFKNSAGAPQDDELSQDAAQFPLAKAPAVSVQIQCGDRELPPRAAVAANGAELQPQGDMPSASPRWVSVHRCKPEIVNLGSWTKIQELVTMPTLGQIYHQRFRETFPGAMDSDRLANKAGGRTLAELAAQELVSRTTGRMKLIKRAGHLTWR